MQIALFALKVPLIAFFSLQDPIKIQALPFAAIPFLSLECMQKQSCCHTGCCLFFVMLIFFFFLKNLGSCLISYILDLSISSLESVSNTFGKNNI